MEKFEIWVLSLAGDLVSRDFTGVSVSVGNDTNLASAFAATGSSTVALPSVEIAAALSSGVVEAAASTVPDGLQALALADSTLSLYRFTATADGLVDRILLGTNRFFGTDGPDLLGNFNMNPALIDEELFGLAGNDNIKGAAGADQIYGGVGDDFATYSVDRSAITLILNDGFAFVEDRTGTDGFDTIRDIETLAFNSTASDSFSLTTYAGLNSLSSDELKSFIELYIAYFNRAPDAVGLGFWGTAFANGTTLQQTAALFIDQNETRATYPDTLANTEFATAVYSNVLGRVADQAGFDFWVNVLNTGSVSRDQFILEILNGAKAAPPTDADQAFIDQQVIDQKYLSDKIDLGAHFAVTYGMSNVANASSAMALFDGSQASLNAAVAAIDNFYTAALDPITGEFLMPLVGVIDSLGLPDAFQAVDNVVLLVEDDAVEIDVLANDTGSGLTVQSFTNPSAGLVEFVSGPSGPLRYTPDDDYTGNDSFFYTAIDDQGNIGTAQVTLIIDPDADVGDTVDTAQALALGDSVMSEIDTDGDFDFYRVEVTEGVTYSIFLQTDLTNFSFMIVTDPNADPIALTEGSSLNYLPDRGLDTFYIGVSRDSQSQQTNQPDYTLSLNQISRFDDIPDGTNTSVHVDLGGDGAWDLAFATGSNGVIEGPVDRDWYGIMMDSDKAYSIAVVPFGFDPVGDVDVFIRDATGSTVQSSITSGGELIRVDPSIAGLNQYYIDVDYDENLTINVIGSYNLSVTEIV
ncbi:MAG: DUF4214 domain-containing protein [Sulfitobacter sp.]